MKNPADRTQGFFSSALVALLILAVLLVLALTIRYVGFPGEQETPSSTSATPLATMPTTTLPSTTTQTTDPTTQTTTETSVPTVTTRESTTYSSATVTVPTTQTTQTTQTTPPETTLPATDYDVSDEAMEALIEQRFLTVHPKSRPGYKLTSVKNIVVHYTGNPGSSADRNWRNFENNKPNTSAHFIIGMEGEIIQCIPLDEVAWAIGTDEGNYTSISIECCHPDATGEFTDATYRSLVRLVSWLCNELSLDRDDVIRHYDYPRYTSSGMEWHKECPLYYADASDPASHARWEAFKDELILDSDPPKGEEDEIEELIEKRFLSIHENSRPGYKLTSLANIVVHYTGNPGTTADQNWRNFENNKPSASAHFIIGLNGEIIQCMPLDEVAWAVGTTQGNYTSISIECCHPDATGRFTDATYESLVKLVSWLCNEFDLDRDKVIRHYDYPRYTSSGMEWHKQCPLYYANDKDPESHKRWEAFLDDLTIE
ncbi:MAG: N-acetylmuramoyl-L-alanine amidase [Clostridia bacterium]|nr:N-acetylmuramoyl-L-alanine amidase [Clostridia bacterium]